MAFTFKLEQEDGTPADARASHGRTDVAGRGHNSLGADKTLRVIETRFADEDPS